MSLLPGNELSKIFSSAFAKIFLWHFHSATALLVFIILCSSNPVTPEFKHHVFGVTNPLVCLESSSVCLKSHQRCRCSSALPSLPWELWPSAAVLSWPRGSVPLATSLTVPCPSPSASRTAGDFQNRVALLEFNSWEMVAPRAQFLRLGFSCSNQENHSNFPEERDENIFTREVTQKGA